MNQVLCSECGSPIADHLCPRSAYPTGTEAEVCQDIAARQRVGVAKYGVTVAENPLPLPAWLEHAYQEALDLPIYLKRAQGEAVRLEKLVADLRTAISIYDHALGLVANTTTNPEGWASDAQIAEHYLPKARALAGDVQPLSEAWHRTRKIVNEGGANG